MKRFICFVLFLLILLSCEFAVNLKNDLFLDFEIGVAGSHDMKIMNMSHKKRSNFVYEDLMAGLDLTMFFGKRTIPFCAFLSGSFFYPLQHRFNTMVQPYINIFNFAVDTKIGGAVRTDLITHTHRGIRFELLLGFHYNWFHEDRFDYNAVGLAAGTGLGMILHRYKAVMLRYSFAWDFADLGTNKNFEPINIRLLHSVAISYSF
jgi:hypothetical protein